MSGSGSPPVEAVGAGTFASSEGKADQPQDKEDDRDYPKKMYCESQAEEQQHEKQRQ
jgi:hypothetical protein